MMPLKQRSSRTENTHSTALPPNVFYALAGILSSGVDSGKKWCSTALLSIAPDCRTIMFYVTVFRWWIDLNSPWVWAKLPSDPRSRLPGSWQDLDRMVSATPTLIISEPRWNDRGLPPVMKQFPMWLYCSNGILHLQLIILDMSSLVSFCSSFLGYGVTSVTSHVTCFFYLTCICIHWSVILIPKDRFFYSCDKSCSV